MSNRRLMDDKERGKVKHLKKQRNYIAKDLLTSGRFKHKVIKDKTQKDRYGLKPLLDELADPLDEWIEGVNALEPYDERDYEYDKTHSKRNN